MHIIQNNFLKRTKASENFVEKYLYWYNDLVFGIHPKRRARWKLSSLNIKRKLQLPETRTDFKAKKAYEGVNLEFVKEKYAQMLSIFVSNLSQEGSREYFQHIGGIFHERSDCFQNQTASLHI